MEHLGMRPLLSVFLLVLAACQHAEPSASSKIESADLVPRVEACRAFRPQRVSRSSSADLINYVVAADAAWVAFKCTDE